MIFIHLLLPSYVLLIYPKYKKNVSIFNTDEKKKQNLLVPYENKYDKIKIFAEINLMNFLEYYHNDILGLERFI